MGVLAKQLSLMSSLNSPGVHKAVNAVAIRDSCKLTLSDCPGELQCMELAPCLCRNNVVFASHSASGLASFLDWSFDIGSSKT